MILTRSNFEAEFYNGRSFLIIARIGVVEYHIEIVKVYFSFDGSAR